MPGHQKTERLLGHCPLIGA